jgi:hypothetical protein
MKKFKAFSIVFCAIFAAVCIAAVSEAAVKITVKNNRNHKMYLAFRWRGFDQPDDRRSGWYEVLAGQTKTLTFEDVVYVFTTDGFGYYAEGGGKVWAGTSSDGFGVIIHSTKAFKGHPDDPISDGKKVYFKPLSLKQTDESRENGSATLTFNP